MQKNLGDELEAIDAVSRAINRVTRHGRFAEFELSNGIVLKLKPVPPLLLQAINQEFVQPDPPVVYMEDKGRDEPNPNDPAYIKEVEALAAKQELAVHDLLLGVGTEVKSVPEGYYPPESDNWIAQVEFARDLSGRFFKIEKDDTIRRYLCWLRFYALETGGDVALATGLPMQLAGIREGEIEEVVESFRGLPEWGANPDGSPEAGSQNGDTANRATRRSRPRN